MAELTYTLRLTTTELTQLLTLLNVALYDMDALIRQSHDHDEIAAYNEQQAIIRKLIRRLSQLTPEQEAGK